MNANTVTAIGISGSPSARSKSRTLLEHALAALAERGATPTAVYGTDSGFENGVPHHTLIARIEQAASEAVVLSERLHFAHSAPAPVPAAARSAAGLPPSTFVES
jgi:NAD(P)H-dependent FMN reductase